MLIEALNRLGPSLSTDLATHLITRHGLTPAAARQRVSRTPVGVTCLKGLPFQRRARFLYLESQYESPEYWSNLYRAIYNAKGAYARALGAVDARQIVPVEHFRIACGAPIAQRKHISADTVLERLEAANVLVRETLPGLGNCVMAKWRSEAQYLGNEEPIARARSRLIAESILIDCMKEWLRRLALASYNSIKVRTGTDILPPKVGTFAWDMTAPSYVAPLTTWHEGRITKPGLVVCDVLLDVEVLPIHIEPYLYKVKTLQALKNVGRAMFFFVGQHYHSEAFNLLRTAGVVPATPESLFGKDVAEAFRDLVGTLTTAAMGSLDPAKFDELFSKLSKLEGATGNMRGAFFELLIAEIVRKTSPAQVQLNKLCTGSDGKAEVDVWELKEGIVARMIECKGIAPGTFVDDNEIDTWLTKRITRIRHHLSKTYNCPKPSFELWTSGLLSDVSKEHIERTRKANANKFDLQVVGPEDLREKARSTNDNRLLRTLEQHFLPNYA